MKGVFGSGVLSPPFTQKDGKGRERKGVSPPTIGYQGRANRLKIVVMLTLLIAVAPRAARIPRGSWKEAKDRGGKQCSPLKEGVFCALQTCSYSCGLLEHS